VLWGGENILQSKRRNPVVKKKGANQKRLRNSCMIYQNHRMDCENTGQGSLLGQETKRSLREGQVRRKRSAFLVPTSLKQM